MNKNRYRIVFNKARNLMMAVAENTTSQGKGQQSGSVRSSSSHPNVAEGQRGAKVIELLQLKPIAFAALCMFGLQPVLLHAAVTADANAAASNRPLIEATANGLPLVQITAPSAAGVSRNQYSQFNVDPSGVILNNSQVNVLTQQGGYVNGNANLANGSARIILNEVTGTGPSSLRGYTEVAGQRAEVIIANPNGIVCDGCGFINTSRGILTTGVPVMSGGSLDSFRVTGGQITIGAGGLNASNTDQLDLIARSLQVNGEIWANNLNVVVGANQVDYTSLGVQVIAGDANIPTVGIDVALLGGMYANKIRLVGTEAGVGVNSLGNMAAQAGDFSLDNKGQITLGGRTNATGNVAITTTGDISNTGTLEGNTITTSSNAFNNSSEVLGDVITINAASINNQTAQARISANTSVDLTASGDITNDGMIEAYAVTTQSNNLTNIGTMLGSQLTLNASKLSNTGSSALIAATESIDLIVSNTVSNTDGATIWSLGDLNAGASSTVDADGYLADNMVSFTNSSGTVQADGDLRISADQIKNIRTKFDPIADVKYSEWVTDNIVVNGVDTDGKTLHYIISNRTESIIKENVTSAAMLLSGGNMWLKGSILNEYSTVAAGKDLSFNGYSTSDSLGAVTESKPEFSFQQVTRNLMQEEKREGTKGDWVWGVVSGHDSCYPCHWVEDYGWVSVPVSYANTVTTIADPVSASASFTAGGDISIVANTLSNLNNGSASTTLGAIQSATPVAGDPNPPALNITLPTNGLFSYNTAPGQNYLIETNPRFASYQNFISSDFMLSRLNLDPVQTQKRLGDGFYEQKLVSDQITGLTGRRFLPGYTSAEAEFKALMEQGLSEAHAQNLIPGVTLTTAQVAALTHDIVWMVAQEVHLADGTTEKLLVPQVFLTRLHENDLRPNGSLIAAENINLKTSGTLLNSGTILGSKTNTLNATDIINQGTLGSGGDTVLVAGNDIKNLSGHISGVRVAVLAGHDIVNETETEELQLGNVFTTRIHNTATIAATDSLNMQAGRDISVSGANIASGGNTSMAAGNNLNLNAKTASESAALVASSGVNGGISATRHQTSQVQTGGDLSLQANNDIQLTAAQINAQHKMYVAAKNINLKAVTDTRQSSFSGYGLVKRNYDEQVIGSSLQAGGDITLVASRKTDSSDDHRDEQHSTGETRKGEERNTEGNINIGGSQIGSLSGKISLTADNNVTVNAVDERHESFEQRTSSSSGFLSSSSTTEIKTSNEKIARGSSIEGDRMSVKTGNSINVIGSDLVASQDLSLTAKNNISLLASQNTYTSGYFKEEKKSGFMSGEGLSISYGDQNQKNIQTSTDISHTASNVGSLNGNVNIKAGQDYTQSGSNVLAPEGDINIAAQEVLINEVQNTGASHSETKFEKTGLTLSISNAVVDAANNIDQQSKASSKTSSGRMKALAVANALMSTNNAVGEVMKGMDGGMMDKAGGVTVSLSIGGSTSESSSTQTHSQAQGSSVTAKGNINIVASSGDDDDTHRTEKENTRDDHDHHNELNKPKRGNITIQGSHIKAGNNTSLEADNDINLLAAKSTAEQHSTNSSSSGSIGVGVNLGSKGAGLTGTASASIGRGNADGSDVTWTNTHVDAGNTLTIKSGRDTNLKGAVASGKQVVANIGGNLNIESLQDTSVYGSQQTSRGGSLSVAIIGTGSGGSVNAADTNINSNYASVMEQSGIKAGDGGYKVKVKGNTDLKGAVIAASDEGLTQSTFATGGILTQSDIQNSASYDAEAYAVSVGTSAGSTSAGLGEDSGNASSTTKSGIGVSTKTDTTGAIAKIFDADKVTEEVNAQAQITQSFSKQAPKAVADYAASRTKPYTDASDYNALNDKQKQGKLTEADQKRLTDLEKQGLTPDSAQATLNDPQSKKDYDNWKEGGGYRVALHTITNALSGGINGATGALVSASAAPLMDELQANVQTSLAKSMGPQAAQMVAKAVADLTATGMGYAAGGVQGAGSALTVDANNRQLHVDERKLLKDRARNIALDKAKSKGINLNNEDLQTVTEYWYEQLSAEASSKVDALANRDRNAYLNAIASTQKPDLEGTWAANNAGNYLDDAAYARTIVAGMSGQSILDNNGNTIVADGGVLKTFQATTSQQYNDFKLFGTSNGATLAQQFGPNANPNVLQSAMSSYYANKQEGLVSQSNDQARLSYFSIVNGATTPDHIVEENILFGMGVKATGLAVNRFKGALVAGRVEAGAGELAVPVEQKVVSPVRIDGDFQTLGLQRDPMTFPDGVKMVQQLERSGLSTDEAVLIARNDYIKSGSTLPVATPIDITDKLVKVVPAGGQPSWSTGYWMRKSDLPSLMQDTASLPSKLGLPPGMQVDKYDVFQIAPRNGALVFESKIAPTTVNGLPNGMGGANQAIVADRNQFTFPVKIDTFTVKKGN